MEKYEDKIYSLGEAGCPAHHPRHSRKDSGTHHAERMDCYGSAW